MCIEISLKTPNEQIEKQDTSIDSYLQNRFHIL